MPTNELSPNRNYPVPVAGNFISYDFPRIRTALLAIDTDVAGLLTSVAGRALATHSHAIADVTGLQAALDAKHPNTWRPALDDLTDVDAPAPTNGQYLRRVGGAWVPASIGGLDAAVITSGVFDPARIPVLTGQAPIVSSGGLADLSAPQQAAIIAGSIVMTTDGFRWAYSGSGSKTDSASYIQLSDITPEWAVIANKPSDFPSSWGNVSGKPSTFPPSTHSHPISEVTGLQTALDGKFNATGGVIGGNVTVGTANASHTLLVKRHLDSGSVGGLIELETTPGSSMVGNLQLRQSGNGLQILEGGGSQRGANLQITDCPAGAAATLTHSGNLKSQLGAVTPGDVGAYGLFRYSIGVILEGQIIGGASLTWSSHTAHTSGGSPTGSWQAHGNCQGAGQVTLFKRVS